MLYDTHCHPYLAKKKDTKKILDNFQKSGDFLNSIGVDIKTSRKSIELAKNSSFIRATIGIHPCDVYNLSIEDTLKELEELYLENKEYIVGIGECGLDYYWLQADKDKTIQKHSPEAQEKIISLKKESQKLFFKAQIQLAKKYKLPLIIHNREAKDDIFKILQEEKATNFIMHCYSEDIEYAQKLLMLDSNSKISFSGILTFKNTILLQETAKNIPLKNILIETDSPYLTPSPYRGKEENEPLFVKYILDKIIELRNEDPKIITKQIFENSLTTFGIKKS